MVELVNRQQIASHCDVSLPTVDAWVRKGCPFVTRGSKGTEWQFDLAAVEKWLAQYWSRPTQVSTRYGTRSFNSTDRAEMVKAMGHLIGQVGNVAAEMAVEAGAGIKVAYCLEQMICLQLDKVATAYLSERGVRQVDLVGDYCTPDAEPDWPTLAAKAGETFDEDECEVYQSTIKWFEPSPEARAESERLSAQYRAAREASQG